MNTGRQRPCLYPDSRQAVRSNQYGLVGAGAMYAPVKE